MILAMTVIMIVTSMIVITLGVTVSGLNLARLDQNRTNAFQFANAGIDQALYRLDRADLPFTATSTYTPTIAGGVLTGFTEVVTIGAHSVVINANQDPPGQKTFWKVQATGTDRSGRQRQAIATVSASPYFNNGFFTVNTFNLSGGQDSPSAYHSLTCVDPNIAGAPAQCNVPIPIPGTLGTNATITGSAETARDFRESWEGFRMYGRASQAEADAACFGGSGTSNSGCGTAPQVSAIATRLDTTPPPSEGGGCPPNGDFGVPGQVTIIQPGNYTCSEVHLHGTIQVGGTGDVRIWNTGPFTATDGNAPADRVVVNRAQRPKRFQVYLPQPAGSPGYVSSDICNSEIWGLLFTPGLVIDCEGSHQPEVYGAVIANSHTAGGGHFDFHWDIDSAGDLNNGKYVVRNWRECPVRLADC